YLFDPANVSNIPINLPTNIVGGCSEDKRELGNNLKLLRTSGKFENHIGRLLAALVHEVQCIFRTCFRTEKNHLAAGLAHGAPRLIRIEHERVRPCLGPPYDPTPSQPGSDFLSSFFCYEKVVINKFDSIHAMCVLEPKNFVDDA